MSMHARMVSHTVTKYGFLINTRAMQLDIGLALNTRALTLTIENSINKQFTCANITNMN